VLLDGDGHTWTALVDAGDALLIAGSFDEVLNSLRPGAEFDDDA
jgi:hypothetical protein